MRMTPNELRYTHEIESSTLSPGLMSQDAANGQVSGAPTMLQATANMVKDVNNAYAATTSKVNYPVIAG
ncbi:hypothetical protein [Pseudoxanthomonas sp. UTMC 1351]|uniref:hypothetical protein n=1 Tax=Pseudoxanthomonas sp. UTMC 1351 TaxID=2695853 RepID=UPI0034CFB199